MSEEVRALQKKLREKLANRPVQPGPMAKMAPEVYAKFSEDLRAWVFERDELMTAIDIASNVTPSMDRAPKVIGRTNEWTGPHKRDWA